MILNDFWLELAQEVPVQTGIGHLTWGELLKKQNQTALLYGVHGIYRNPQIFFYSLLVSWEVFVPGPFLIFPLVSLPFQQPALGISSHQRQPQVVGKLLALLHPQRWQWTTLGTISHHPLLWTLLRKGAGTGATAVVAAPGSGACCKQLFCQPCVHTTATKNLDGFECLTWKTHKYRLVVPSSTPIFFFLSFRTLAYYWTEYIKQLKKWIASFLFSTWKQHGSKGKKIPWLLKEKVKENQAFLTTGSRDEITDSVKTWCASTYFQLDWNQSCSPQKAKLSSVSSCNPVFLT